MKRLAGLSLTCLLIFAGCAGEDVDRPPVYKVTGTLTYKGAPVANADLTFFNDGARRSAFGKTDEDGKYHLTTFVFNDGAVEGKSDVTVIQIPPIPPTSTTLPDTESEDYAPPELGEDTTPVHSTNTLPKKYADRATSGLIGIVNPDDSNVIDFELTD